jgi:8-oxo-dGTP pyrophosphatase MutT (NUDIX family)
MGTQAIEHDRHHSRAAGASGRVARGRDLARRLFFRLWAHLPEWAQARLLRWGARKVTVGACAVIEDGQGRVLVARHPYRHQPWALPGGLIGRGEQPAAALARELGEELGVVAEIGDVLHVELAPCGHMTLYFAAHVDTLPCPDGVEIDQCRYMAPVTFRMLFGADRPAWLHLLDRRRSACAGGAA